MSPPGPKELANRANGEAKRKRKLIPYAGKPRDGGEANYGNKPPNTKPPRQRRKYKRRIT